MALILMSFAWLDKPAYQIFDAKGDKSDYKQLLKKAAKADIILFGELHNNPISHWLQLELTKDLYEKAKDKLVLGAEMFETDNQLIIDEYLSDIINEKKFEGEARLWPNYKTDYKPLVQLAKDNSLPFVATNIPRRYASVVFNQGLEGLEQLSEDAKRYIAPLPIEVDLTLPGYKKMLEMGGHGHAMSKNFPKAQAIKEATMAHFIVENWKKGKQFIHFNGTYHSDNYEGIVWYLKKANPKLKILTISATEQVEVETLAEDMQNQADFIIATPESMTKTH